VLKLEAAEAGGHYAQTFSSSLWWHYPYLSPMDNEDRIEEVNWHRPYAMQPYFHEYIHWATVDTCRALGLSRVGH
jgi:hypothetical protein